MSAHAAALALAERHAAGRRVQRRVPAAWRNVASQPQVTRLVEGYPDGSRTADDDVLEVEWYAGRDGYRFAHRDALPSARPASGRSGWP